MPLQTSNLCSKKEEGGKHTAGTLWFHNCPFYQKAKCHSQNSASRTPLFLTGPKGTRAICSLLCRGPRNLEDMEGRADWKSWRFASPQYLARETRLRRVSFSYYWQENQRGPRLRAEGEEETNRATEGIVSHGCHCNRASVQLQSSLALFSPL